MKKRRNLSLKNSKDSIFLYWRHSFGLSVHAMKANGGVEEGPQLHSFLTSALDQGE
jgi:hypothetical protein